MAGRTACAGAGHGMVGNAKMAVVLLRGVKRCWGVTARPQPRTVSAARQSASFSSSGQSPYRRVAPGHKDALRLDLSAYFVLQFVTDLFQKH